MSTNICTIPGESTTIEQSKDSVLFSADQIIEMISELHVCYDYCAVWKEGPPDEIEICIEANRSSGLSHQGTSRTSVDE